MKKVIKKIALIVLICSASIVNTKGQNNAGDSLKTIFNKVNGLENYRLDLKAAYDSNLQGLRDEIKNEMRETRKSYDLIIDYGLPGTAIALLSLLFGGRRYLKKEIEKKISSIVHQKREDIIGIVKEHQIENKIKREKKITVLSSNQSDESMMHKYFQDLKFNMNNLTFKVITQYEPITNGSLVIFNMLGQQLIRDYLNNSNESEIFVAYTLENIERSHQLNYSNSKFTLYSRIIETIKYNEFLES